MAATTPPITTRTNGQTIDQTWFNILKTILEDHEGRIESIENEILYFLFEANSLLDHLVLPNTGFIQIPITDDITVIDCQITVLTAGSAGTVQTGFEYKRGIGAWTSILTTQPSSIYTDGSNHTTTNGTVDPLNNTLDAGDFLRLNITNLQTDLRNWSVAIAYQRNA